MSNQNSGASALPLIVAAMLLALLSACATTEGEGESESQGNIAPNGAEESNNPNDVEFNNNQQASNKPNGSLQQQAEEPDPEGGNLIQNADVDPAPTDNPALPPASNENILPANPPITNNTATPSLPAAPPPNQVIAATAPASQGQAVNLTAEPPGGRQVLSEGRTWSQQAPALATPPPLPKPPPARILWWIGYTYEPGQARTVIELITRGIPKFTLRQERNKAGQIEVVVRFLDTALRNKVRRPLDASEFLSPVAYVRTRDDTSPGNAEVLITLREPVQPRVFAQDGNVRLTFEIVDSYYGRGPANDTPKTENAELLAKITPFFETGSEFPADAKPVPAPNPAGSTFADAPADGGAPVSLLEEGVQTAPTSDTEPLASETDPLLDLPADSANSDPLADKGNAKNTESPNEFDNFNNLNETATPANNSDLNNGNTGPKKAKNNFNQFQQQQDGEFDEFEDNDFETSNGIVFITGVAADNNAEFNEENLSDFETTPSEITSEPVLSPQDAKPLAVKEANPGESELFGGANTIPPEPPAMPSESPPAAAAAGTTDATATPAAEPTSGSAPANGSITPAVNGGETGASLTNTPNVPENSSEPAPVEEVGSEQEGTRSKFNGRPMRIDFRGARFSEVARAISDEAGASFIYPPDIGALMIDLSLKDIPWDEALKALLETYSLGLVDMGGKVVRIDRLANLKREQELQEQARLATVRLTPTKILVMRLSYADPKDITKSVTTLLEASRSVDPRVKVDSDVRTNSLIVEATPNDLAKVKALVDRLDQQTPQVQILSRIVEIGQSLQRSLGINWFGTNNFDAGRGLGFGSLLFPNSLISRYAVDPGGIGRADAASTLAGPGADLGFQFGSLNNSMNLDLRLKMSEAQGYSDVLQTTNIVVRDNADAEIVAGTSDFVRVIQPTGVAGTPTATLQQINFDLTLKVKPHITSDGAVQMNLDLASRLPRPSSISETNIGATNRSVKTSLIRRSGETLVIGGLYSTNKSKQTSGIPLLSQIPIIGALFRSTLSKDDKQELVVMVTPTVLNRDQGVDGSGGLGTGGAAPALAGPDTGPTDDNQFGDNTGGGNNQATDDFGANQGGQTANASGNNLNNNLNNSAAANNSGAREANNGGNSNVQFNNSGSQNGTNQVKLNQELQNANLGSQQTIGAQPAAGEEFEP